MKQHTYSLNIEWTGNTGVGTSGYKTYNRDHQISAPGKPAISGSSDPAFRGNPARYNPEELLVASLSACHMLWYLHLCAVNGVVVVSYTDAPVGTMEEDSAGSGRFTHVALKPQVLISAESDATKAHLLHSEAHGLCFLARSVNFPVTNEPVISKAPAAATV